MLSNMVSLKAIGLAAVGFASQVVAHGNIMGYTVNGKYIDNFVPNPWKETQKVTPGWFTNNPDFGFVAPSTYANGDIICHKSATPGQLSIKAKAGDVIHLQWSRWVPSHHGPMMHYMANAGGDFASVDKFKLKWNKIDQLGLIDPDHSWNTSAAQPAGYYAADELIMQGGRWDFQIPESIGPANYILRAETIALHDSMILNGTQHYPQCINVEVTEGGSDYLDGGVIGTELYKPTDPGIGMFDIFATDPIYSNYPIPGPPIHECGQKGYDQTPHFGSAPKWHGPDTAEPFGLGSDSSPVGKVGVDAPNGPTYGESPAATTTTTGGTTTAADEYAMTTSAPNGPNYGKPPAATTTTGGTTTAADEYSMTTSAPALTPSAGSTPPLEVHTSWTSHTFMEPNATASATGTYPTGTAVPVYGSPVDNSGENAGGDITSTPSSAAATTGDHPTSGSNPTSSNDNSGSNPTSSNDNSGSNPTSSNDNSGSDNHSATGGLYTSPDSPTGSGTSPSSGTSTNSLVDNNNNHDTCPEPTPAKVDSSATPTDDSTVAQLFDIMDVCLKKLKAKLTNKLRRHARDVLRTRV